MPHRPLLALAIITCVSAAFLIEIEARDTEILIFGALAGVGIMVAWIRRRPDLIRGAGGVVLGCWIALQLPSTWVGEAGYGQSHQGRAEGEVESVRRLNGRTSAFTVSGEVDLRSAPACSARVYVKLQTDTNVATPDVNIGDRVVLFGRFVPFVPALEAGAFDEIRWARSASLMMRCNVARTDVHRVATSGTMSSALRRLRAEVSERCRRHLSPQTAAVVYAMLTGDRTLIDRRLSKQFGQAGVAHMLSVSGSHVGLIISILLSVFGPLARSRWTTVLAVIALIVYGLFTGAEPPTVRAVIMAVGALIGRVRERDADTLNLLGAATLIVLLADPTMITNTSFLLSTIATYGILVVYPKWFSRLPGRHVVRSSVALNLSACGVMTVPALLLLDMIALIAPIANLIVVPMLTAAMIAGFVLQLCADVPLFAASVAWCLERLIEGAVGFITMSSTVYMTFQPEKAALVALVYTALLLWPSSSGPRRAFAVRSVVSGIWFLLVVTYSEPERSSVAVRTLNNGVQIHVVCGAEQRVATITTKYGTVFVRSQDGTDPARLP